MKQNKSRPAVANHQQGDISLIRQYKDTQKLSFREQRLYDLLRTGAYCVAEISQKLGYCDPRGLIRNIRNKGYSVGDYWVNKRDVRFKRYFAK